MNKYSKNTKLNTLLLTIESDLIEFGIDEIKRYMKDFKNEVDYNIAQYGNLLCYYSDIYKLYRDCGYVSTDNYTTTRIWETYKRQVGYIARILVDKNK